MRDMRIIGCICMLVPVVLVLWGIITIDRVGREEVAVLVAE